MLAILLSASRPWWCSAFFMSWWHNTVSLIMNRFKTTLNCLFPILNLQKKINFDLCNHQLVLRLRFQAVFSRIEAISLKNSSNSKCKCQFCLLTHPSCIIVMKSSFVINDLQIHQFYSPSFSFGVS